jgi:hypothetical protein
METSAWNCGANHDLVEDLREPIGMRRRAGGGAEDVVVVGDASPELLFDAITPSFEDPDGRGVEMIQRLEFRVLPRDSCSSYATETSARFTDRCAVLRSMSLQWSPSSSLRRMPVFAASQNAGNRR